MTQTADSLHDCLLYGRVKLITMSYHKFTFLVIYIQRIASIKESIRSSHTLCIRQGSKIIVHYLKTLCFLSLLHMKHRIVVYQFRSTFTRIIAFRHTRRRHLRIQSGRNFRYKSITIHSTSQFQLYFLFGIQYKKSRIRLHFKTFG